MSADQGAPVSLFSGVRILELAQWVFVPAAGSLFADWGADVIKIEHPTEGDPYRGLESQGITKSIAGVNYSIEAINRGKKSIGLDIKNPAGRELLLRLVSDVDVFLTNFRPGALERAGLGVEELRRVNPRLIYARGHGFGVRGPDRDMPAYDATAFWARGGVTHVLTPEEVDFPIQQRGAFGDRQAAMNLAFGVAGALYRQAQTGVGSVVDVSLLASSMWTMTSDVISALQGGEPRQTTSRARIANPLVNTFKTSDDRFISLVLLQPDRYWAELCEVLERPDLGSDPRFADMAIRGENREACLSELDATFGASTYREWCDKFEKTNFPWAPVQAIEEILTDRQVIANGYISEVATETTTFRIPNGPVQIDEQAATLGRAPEHGQHTEEILLDAGFSWEEIVTLKEQGAII
jgi:crotonobetainyl-CoA:carnitine CoA-transferase CaiB-like acyl-CoA transferase